MESMVGLMVEMAQGFGQLVVCKSEQTGSFTYFLEGTFTLRLVYSVVGKLVELSNREAPRHRAVLYTPLSG
jgi:hypothetical protein